MNKTRLISVIVVLLLSVQGCFASSYSRLGSKSHAQSEQDKQILQACREALLELQHRREVETQLQKKIAELEASNLTQAEQIKKYEAAIAKYEAAVAIRTQAELLVDQLRQNYEKQVATVEKDLAVERTKTGFWKALAVVGVVAGFVLGMKAAGN